MGMSTHVEGFIPPDAKFKKMLEAYRACEKAGVEIPAEVDKFFNGEPPDEAGVKISMSYDKKYKDAVYEYHDENSQGYEIDLRKLPADIKIVRVSNSW
jgi:hypothetical protein